MGDNHNEIEINSSPHLADIQALMRKNFTIYSRSCVSFMMEQRLRRWPIIKPERATALKSGSKARFNQENKRISIFLI